MNENAQYVGIFSVFTNKHYTTEALRQWCESGRRIEDLVGVELVDISRNILMADRKQAMANAVYPNIDRLVITSQTSTPEDTETGYSGTMYTTVTADEFSRSASGNPYTVQWNITTDTANGNWGSFILIDSGGSMINRALAGVTKASGTSKIVQFTGSVI